MDNNMDNNTKPLVPLRTRIKYIASVTWPFFFSILTPILLSTIFIWTPPDVEPALQPPPPTNKISYKKVPHALYLTALMAAYWVSECVPHAITSLLPIVLAPLFGITSSEVICGRYFNGTIIFLLCGCIVAIAFEYSNLHTRISFLVMKSMGAKAPVLLFGMMMTCMTLSCWMNNTSTTAMMVPVIGAIMEQYKDKMIPKETAQQLAEKHGPISGEGLPTQLENKAIRSSQVEPAKQNTSEEPTSSVEDITAEGAEKEEESSENPNDNTVSQTYPKAVTDKDVKYWQGVIDSKTNYVRNLEIMFLLGAAVASNIGGTGVLTGTGTNLIAVSALSTKKNWVNENRGAVKDANKCLSSDIQHAYWDIDFLRWIILNFLVMLINVLLSWIFLAIYFEGLPSSVVKFWRRIRRQPPDLMAARKVQESKKVAAAIHSAIETQYQQLGRTTFHQWMILILFLLLLSLWIFANPLFGRPKPKPFTNPERIDTATLKLVHPKCVPKTPRPSPPSSPAPPPPPAPKDKYLSTWGWTRPFGDRCDFNYFAPYVPTTLVCFLLFVMPKETKYYKNILRGGFADGLADPLLTNEYVAKQMPWGPMFMLGGGLALSQALTDSKLGTFLKQVMDKSAFVHDISVFTLLAASLLFVCLLTTIASNTATAVIVTPILIELALVKGVPPIFMVVPPIVGASYAFCLPISTPPNAIVYDKGNMKQRDMFIPGFFLTIICNVVLYILSIFYMGFLILRINEYGGYCNSANAGGSARSTLHYLHLDHPKMEDFEVF